jgi:hypothetical protein
LAHASIRLVSLGTQFYVASQIERQLLQSAAVNKLLASPTPALKAMPNRSNFGYYGPTDPSRLDDTLGKK